MALHEQQHIGRNGLASAFRWSILLNTALSVVQLLVGTAFGSLALVGDAVHNLGDVAGLGLGWGRSGSPPVRQRSASPTALAAAPSWQPLPMAC